MPGQQADQRGPLTGKPAGRLGEGVAVVTLHQVGGPLAAALSATLLFRGVSCWLPMLPGFVASRRLRRR